MRPQLMQNMKSKGSDQSSVHSKSPSANCPSWWHSAGTQITQASLSENLKFNFELKIPNCIHGKESSLQLKDGDSTSTQSTGQSNHGIAGTGRGISYWPCISAQTGSYGIYGWQADEQMKPASSLGTTDLVTPPSQYDYSHFVTHIPYAYAESYFGGVLTAYGPSGVIHPPLMGMTPGRVPLPVDLAEGPIYVNAKQYHAILRRRQARTKLLTQNKLAKDRKPYLHESRHLHAMSRVRGSGGRFLNTKMLKQSNQSDSGSAPSQLGSNPLRSKALEPEDSNAGASATCSDVTSVSNDDGLFGQPDIGFTSAISSHIGGCSQSGGSSMMYNGFYHRI